jgi:hypothetical protein
MKVKVPEPVGPVWLYKYDAKNRLFQKPELESELNEIERGLDKACDELKSGKYSVASNSVIVTKCGTEYHIGDLISGGFVLTER